ncbi:PD-(D/E)XK nuclease domain-containing protein [uncultured Mitsuokella sp.]|uniref:PD-(D/E)XK nuclease domain-containing protein n=1 Tax=uncultured Mitsuokella sp. TaxID=453120 RepID=UPI002599D502|nr:PD-(D/E)XK nuclease domain-containing protein [uncultured Mitsuokella sp.]
MLWKEHGFKAADTADELTRKAQEARRQIDEKGYEVDFQARGIEKVLKYGIAFCGKQVVLV